MCKVIVFQDAQHGAVDVKTSSRCILKSRVEVKRSRTHRKSRKVVIPASVFLAASEYGLEIAQEGMAKDASGMLYWHDPWGIREALVYSFRNACIALGSFDAKIAKWLEKEARAFANNDRSKVAKAERLLGGVLSERWTQGLDTKQVKFDNRQLNVSAGPSKVDTVLSSCIQLADGSRLPRLGFGTAIFDKDCNCITGWQCGACMRMASALHKAVLAAVKYGYRHFDCAQCYNNEAVIGEALKVSGVSRKDLFLASKLSSPGDYGSAATVALVEKQLRKLQTTYLDLYYLHDDIEDFGKEKAAWRALERLHDRGIIKHIGLSNYRVDGIKRVMSFARVLPSVLQVKYDVYHPGYSWATAGIDDVVEFAREQDIAVVGYANFSGWPSLLRARDDPHIVCMAQRYGRTPTQVILRHCLQKGLAVVPASLSEAHIKDNSRAFEFSLEEADLAYLDSLASFASFERMPWLPEHGAHQNIFKVCT